MKTGMTAKALIIITAVLCSLTAATSWADYGATIRCYGEGGWESKPYALFEVYPRTPAIPGDHQYRCTVIIVHRDPVDESKISKGVVNPGAMKHQWSFPGGNPDHYAYEINSQTRWANYATLVQVTHRVACQAQKHQTQRVTTSNAADLNVAGLGFQAGGQCSIDIVNGHDMGTVTHDLWLIPCCGSTHCPWQHGDHSGLCNCEFWVCPNLFVYLIDFEGVDPDIARFMSAVCVIHTGVCDMHRCTNYNGDQQCSGMTCQHCNRCTVCGRTATIE